MATHPGYFFVGIKKLLKLPQEYHYAYLRVKGMGHSDALERMGLPAQTSTESAPKNTSWWKFW